MSRPRFFIEGRRACGQSVALHGTDAHKIVAVLRLRDGDEIEAIDSAGGRFLARLEIAGRDVAARLETLLDDPGAAWPWQVTVAQGIPKGQKMDFVVEKLTELGVARIVPLIAERSIAQAGAGKMARWRRLAKTAATQSGRSDVPTIADALDLDALLVAYRQDHAIAMPWELAQRVPLRQTLPPIVRDARNVLIVIGPEGGFSHDEAARARAAGAHLVWLGRTILRTETAAMAMLAILGYLGDEPSA